MKNDLCHDSSLSEINWEFPMIDNSISSILLFTSFYISFFILQRESKVRVRCLFDYTSKDDPHIPCEDAGLDFKKGDILHIVSQDDIYW